MKKNGRLLLLCLGIPLAVGAIAGLLTMGSMGDYQTMAKPPLSPPGWLFPVVWTALYALMGYASYLVATSAAPKEQIRKALVLYGLQLAANFLWPILFFSLEAYFLAFIWLVALWVLILLTMRAFYRIETRAGDLLLPYLLWVTFAAYLNFGVWLLN